MSRQARQMGNVKLFTIGHSNHNIDKFVLLLQDNGVMTLVDVRTVPYSRYNPQFNKASLENLLPKHGIQYKYAGKYLGGRPSDATCYKGRVLPAEGVDYLQEVDYLEVMKRPWFQLGIKRLLELASKQTTAIMCSEENPVECHRHHLIGQYLIANHPDIDVQHIRGNGVVYGARSILASVSKPSAEQLPLF